jgi:hypothetical protein
MSALGLVVSGRSFEGAREQRVDVSEQMHRADWTAPAASQTPIDTDFVQSLGPRLPTAPLIQALQRASASAGVLLASVQAQAPDAPAEQLGRLELNVTLHGPYTGAKQVLKQAVERFPQLTVRRLRIRRGQSTNDVDTVITLSLWSAPR